MSKLSIRVIIHESAWLAPELLTNEEFLQDWSRKYWGVSLDQELQAVEDNNDE